MRRTLMLSSLSLVLLGSLACESGKSTAKRTAQDNAEQDNDAEGSDSLEVEDKPSYSKPHNKGLAIRNFREVNYTIASITGVSVGNQAVRSTYNSVKANLPSTHQADGVSTAGQAGLVKLATSYCQQMLIDSSQSVRRTQIFGQRDLTAALESAQVEELVEKMATTMLPGMTDEQSAVLTELARGFVDEGATTETTAKAICVVMLASSSLLFY